jgi:hypothetical protein
MPMWRCPHCGTPQAETARCWVCRRSSTACGTCRHFRRSVADRLGYCGLDRGRQPLLGDEIRGCWEARPAGLADPTAPSLPVANTNLDRASAPRREFVEVRAGTDDEREPEVAPGLIGGNPAPGTEPGWSLWGDVDR